MENKEETESTRGISVEAGVVRSFVERELVSQL